MPFEPLQTIVDRVETAIDFRKDSVAGSFVATTVNLRIDDVQRLVHAAIWGDDA